ncbi:hypothetical protein I4F81_011406 [Pyropia yezoensis]|uniref:Uncharacterized protein n=1 Tax=Pyropia yezoensis TaxID=2788 RepID=A0ACC3CF64_PYRYE|nr:hypothetical protein I4F81_011406 [Neopyropia yezoensis]
MADPTNSRVDRRRPAEADGRSAPTAAPPPGNVATASVSSATPAAAAVLLLDRRRRRATGDGATAAESVPPAAAGTVRAAVAAVRRPPPRPLPNGRGGSVPCACCAAGCRAGLADGHGNGRRRRRPGHGRRGTGANASVPETGCSVRCGRHLSHVFQRPHLASGRLGCRCRCRAGGRAQVVRAHNGRWHGQRREGHPGGARGAGGGRSALTLAVPAGGRPRRPRHGAASDTAAAAAAAAAAVVAATDGSSFGSGASPAPPLSASFPVADSRRATRASYFPPVGSPRSASAARSCVTRILAGTASSAAPESGAQDDGKTIASLTPTGRAAAAGAAAAVVVLAAAVAAADAPSRG